MSYIHVINVAPMSCILHLTNPLLLTTALSLLKLRDIIKNKLRQKYLTKCFGKVALSMQTLHLVQ
jgi:hypothetical protein